MDKDLRNEKRGKGNKRSGGKLRKVLLSCLIVLIVVIAGLGITWLFVKDNLGELASGYVLKAADESLNGRLEFDKLDIDLAGRAVAANLRIYHEDSEEPWVSAPKVVVGMDFMNFIGPNRGTRAIVLTLHDAKVKLTRLSDGSFNLNKLAKEPEKEKEPMDLALSVMLKNAEVDFTDQCLLAQGYPKITAEEGTLFAELLEELGYDELGGPAGMSHKEVLGLDGDIVFNSKRGEISVKATIERQDDKGTITARGSSNDAGTEFDFRIGLNGIEASSLSSYAKHLFPNLHVTGFEARNANELMLPALSARFDDVVLNLKQQEAKDGGAVPAPEISVDGRMSNVFFASLELPQAEVPRVSVDYNASKQQLNLDLLASALGIEVEGKPRLNLESGAMQGNVRVTVSDAAALLEHFGVEGLSTEGSLGADVTLEGTTDEPELTASVRTGTLAIEQMKLGKASGKITYASNIADFDDVKFSGGDLPLDVTGQLNTETQEGSIRAHIGPAEASRVIEIAKKFAPDVDTSFFSAAGMIKAEASVKLKDGEPDITGSVSSESLDVAVKQEGSTVIQGKVRLNASFSMANGEPVISGNASGDSLNLSLKSDGKSIAAGRVKLAASLSSPNGKPSVSIDMSSAAIDVSGQKLSNVKVKAKAAPPNISIDEATATFTTAEPIELADFSSSGPLELAVRLGGSVSLQEKGPAVLSLVGEANTKNLAPEQADISFKAIGPADDPELRIQLKTDNETNPLVARVVGHYREGMSPVDATLNWYSTEATFDGEVDITGQRVDGTAKASNVDIARFSPDDRFSGTASVEAQLSGSFEKLTVSGRATAPLLSFEGPQRTYNMRDLSAGFKLADGEAVSINDGSFDFEGNKFTAGGVLGHSNSEIRIESQNFNLFSVAALAQGRSIKPGEKSSPVMAPLDIRSSGPLNVLIAGTLEDPAAAVTYSSGAGSIEGHSFQSASLSAAANKNRVLVESFNLMSSNGSINLSGQYLLENGKFDAEADVENFDLALIAPLAGTTLLEDARGILNGSAEVNGTGSNFTADGSLRLANGRLKGVEIERASADVRTDGTDTFVENGELVAEGTMLTFGGTLKKDLNRSSFSANAAELDLAVLKFLMPQSASTSGGAEFDGIVSVALNVVPSSGEYPDVTVNVRDTGGGVNFGGFPFSSLRAEASLTKDTLTVSGVELASGGSSFSIGGDVNLAQLTKVEGRGSDPALDFWLRSSGFNFSSLAELMPAEQRSMLPSGAITADLTLRGRQSDPKLNGTLTVIASDLPPPAPVIQGGAIAASIKFTNNAFDISPGNLSSSGGNLSPVQIQGNGVLLFEAPYVQNGSFSVSLSEGGTYTRAVYYNGDRFPGNKMFDGSVGGLLSVRFVPKDQRRGSGPIEMETSGTLYVNEPGSESTFYMRPSEPSGEETEPVNFFSNLKVIINPGTNVEMLGGGADLQAKVQGNLSFNGAPDAPLPGQGAPDNRLALGGSVFLDEGSAFVFGRTIRLDPTYAGGQSKLAFRGQPGDMFPVFDGRGVLTMPRVLPPAGEGDTIETSGLEMQGGSSRDAGRWRDLTVFLTFNEVYLNPEEGLTDKVRVENTGIPASGGGASQEFGNKGYISLSSEPSLPPDKILSYLLGNPLDVFTGDSSVGDMATGFGLGFISRAIERELGLQAFTFGGTGNLDNPYFIDAEKSLTPQLSLTYYRDFYNTTGQAEEIGFKYSILGPETGDRYRNVNLEVNFIDDERRGTGSEFMFTWSTRF